jgi:hypothetical protein
MEGRFMDMSEWIITAIPIAIIFVLAWRWGQGRR